ncbi:MAG: hypothetical protein INR62_08755 [Rhodospirillales bacterium]|nr:hypothetical protein [Acetobacter sp.]
MILADDSRRTSLAAGPESSAQPTATPPPRVNTLEKPQRATTNATPPDPGKKKRFSALGSLFGRSSTSAGNKTERPRKLMKQPSASRDAPASNASGGYEAFEEARRREARPKSPEIGLPSRESEDIHTAAVNFPVGYGPPDGGWYGPGEREVQQQEPQYRVLHSERERVDMPLDNVPEAFRPVDASYGRPAAPVGPLSQAGEPQQQRQLYSPPTSPVGGQRSFSGGQYPMAASPPPPPPAHRHASYGSNEYQLSPQVSGQSEYQYQRPDWRGPAISPPHSRAGSETFVRPQQMRVGSIGEEISRGPPPPPPPQQRQTYTDQQQRPWAVSMPPPAGVEGHGRRISNTPAWMYEGEYPAYEDYSRSSGPYPPMGVPKHRALSPQQYPPQAQNRYPSPPYSPPYQQHQQTRYYSHPTPASQHSGGPPTTHQRSASGGSGYTGRRDEPALGEEGLGLEMEMRGSSYPGQEWAPGRWD